MHANDAMSSAGGKATNILALELANLFPDLKTAYIEASLVAGHCSAIFDTADASDATQPADLQGNIDDNGGWKETVLAWDGSTAGVSSNGLIVGTAPKLALKTSTT